MRTRANTEVSMERLENKKRMTQETAYLCDGGQENSSYSVSSSHHVFDFQDAEKARTHSAYMALDLTGHR